MARPSRWGGVLVLLLFSTAAKAESGFWWEESEAESRTTASALQEGSARSPALSSESKAREFQEAGERSHNQDSLEASTATGARVRSPRGSQNSAQHSAQNPEESTAEESAAEGPEYAALRESQLRASARGERRSSQWDGDIEPHENPFASSAWFKQRLAEQRRWGRLNLLPSVFPEVSARSISVAGRGRGGGVDIDQMLHVSLYALELWAPLMTFRSGEELRTGDHFRLGLKLPFHLSKNNWLALFASFDLPTRDFTTYAESAGAESALGWGYGGNIVSTQLRIGYGYTRLLGAVGDGLGSMVLWDANLSFALNKHLRISLQADGRRSLSNPSWALRAWPGLRWYPQSEGGLSLGVGALWWMEREAGHSSSRRVGGSLDVGYLFF